MSSQGYAKINKLEKQPSGDTDENLEPLLEDDLQETPNTTQPSLLKKQGDKIRGLFNKKQQQPQIQNQNIKYQPLESEQQSQQVPVNSIEQQQQVQQQNKDTKIGIYQGSESQKTQPQYQTTGFPSLAQMQPMFYQQSQHLQQAPQPQHSFTLFGQNIVQGQPVRMFPQQFNEIQNLPSAVDEWHKYSRMINLWAVLSFWCIIFSIFSVPFINLFGLLAGCFGLAGSIIVKKKAAVLPVNEFIDHLYYFSFLAGVFQAIHVTLLLIIIAGVEKLTYCEYQGSCFELTFVFLVIFFYYSTHMFICFFIRKIAYYIRNLRDNNQRGLNMFV